MSDFRREIRFKPGFDHRDDPDKRKRNYGCHGMDIRFLLHGDKGTMQFLVYSGWLPGKQDIRILELGPMGVDVGHHWDTPQYADQTPRDCDLRPNGRCYYDGSGLAADDLFAKFTAEGDAVVWAELERRYASLLSEDGDE